MTIRRRAMPIAAALALSGTFLFALDGAAQDKMKDSMGKGDMMKKDDMSKGDMKKSTMGDSMKDDKMEKKDAMKK